MNGECLAVGGRSLEQPTLEHDLVMQRKENGLNQDTHERWYDECIMAVVIIIIWDNLDDEDQQTHHHHQVQKEFFTSDGLARHPNNTQKSSPTYIVSHLMLLEVLRDASLIGKPTTSFSLEFLAVTLAPLTHTKRVWLFFSLSLA